MRRFPMITRPAQHGGDCPPEVVRREPDIRPCNTDPCPREYMLYTELKLISLHTPAMIKCSLNNLFVIGIQGQ